MRQTLLKPKTNKEQLYNAVEWMLKCQDQGDYRNAETFRLHAQQILKRTSRINTEVNS